LIVEASAIADFLNDLEKLRHNIESQFEDAFLDAFAGDYANAIAHYSPCPSPMSLPPY
jgi:hypothetical protein